MNTSDSPLPQNFLRGLEADLRSLSADARRRNPGVKEAAERAILLLKEADSPSKKAAAADEAASAFCAACDPLDSSQSSSGLSLQIKVALRAVSSLHKLLTHRAISVSKLGDVLDALARLARPALDDNLTVKVLQGLLSLLTVRSYVSALTETQLSRAFSLLFVLKSRAGHVVGGGVVGAISQMGGGGEGGVIEQTSKAAFRQASSDLFAVAADAAVRTAIEHSIPSGERIELDAFPSETKAAFSLCIDLCSAANGEAMTWVADKDEGTGAVSVDLALEVLDDVLASNFALFGGQQVFVDVLAGNLCPVLHHLLTTTKEKTGLKCLLGVIVTVVRLYWRILLPDAEAMLYALAKMASDDTYSWRKVYSVEAMRCIFRSVGAERSPFAEFVNAFDLEDNSKKLIADVVSAACDTMNLVDKVTLEAIPAAPINGNMKPFANAIASTDEYLVAISSGLYIEVIRATSDAVRQGQKEVAKVLLNTDTTERAVSLLGKVMDVTPQINGNAFSRLETDARLGALKAISEALALLTIAASDCDLEAIRERALATLASTSKTAVRASIMQPAPHSLQSRRIKILFDQLFYVQRVCRDSLGRCWVPFVEAIEQLDMLIHKTEADGEVEGSEVASSMEMLQPKLNLVFTSTSELKWSACHDLISALVQTSRQTISVISKRMVVDDQAKADSGQPLRIFGISAAEEAILHAFQRKHDSSDAIPATLWQLLTGHLTSVCADSEIPSLRRLALRSLTKIACGAISNGDPPFVEHDKVITPFLDLFTAHHVDIRSGSLSSIHRILETQGERLRGGLAWTAVLKVLSTAAGSTSVPIVNGTETEPIANKDDRQLSIQSTPQAAPNTDMMSEAFKVVQVISDDFLTSLVENALPAWIEVLRLYSRQNEDVNVALTSIGLLWRTADFFAKNSDLKEEDRLWVQLFEVLKEISMDDRPEIRNCAVKTLTGTLSAHSFRLSALAWNGCVERALLPLLEQVMRGGVLTDDNTSSSRVRGDTQLLLHHSRDTPRKQWNETRVLALSGVAKVLRTAMPRLAVLQDESGRPLFLMLTDGGPAGLWRKMLRAAGVAAGSRDREVAIAGVSALLELQKAAGYVVGDRTESDAIMQAAKVSKSIPSSKKSANSKEATTQVSWIGNVMGASESEKVADNPRISNTNRLSKESAVLLWEEVWSALVEAIGGKESTISTKHNALNGYHDEAKIVDEKALEMLAGGLLEARVDLGSKFTSRSSVMFVEVLLDLARGRGTSVDQVDGELTGVQEATIRGLENVEFENDSESWVGLIQGLLNIIEEQLKKNRKNPSKLARRILDIIGELYTGEKVPKSVKRSELKAMVRVIGGIMLLRNAGDDAPGNMDQSLEAGNKRPLWMEGTDVMMRAMRCGTESGYEGPSDEVWLEFVSVMELFLYSGYRVQESKREYGPGNRAEELQTAEDYDIRLTKCVREALGNVGQTNAEIKRRLVGLLSMGAEEGKTSGRPKFVRSCQKRLFGLAGNEDGGVVNESNKCIVETCGRVLGQYIADGQRAGRCPLPAGRRAEAVFLLRELQRLNKREGWERWMGMLYTRLCECVESKDEAVRILARKVLDEAAGGGGGAGKEIRNGGMRTKRVDVGDVR